MSNKITFADVLKAADTLYGDTFDACKQAIYEWDKLARLDFHVDEMPILQSMGAFNSHLIHRDTSSGVAIDTPTNILVSEDCPEDDMIPYDKAESDAQDAHYIDERTTKPTNPKDAIGSSKPPLSCVSMPVMFEVGAAMLEGSCKYGRHNYRVAGVRASVYFDAAMRHLARWWEGEDLDPDSGVSHITKCIAGLVVLRDAQINGMVAFDDRPPRAHEDWYVRSERRAKNILDKYPNPVAPCTQVPPQQ
jgi:hypothetical protein